MRKTNLNKDWKFYSDNATEINHINVPHDAMIGKERAGDNPSGSAGAFFPGGKYFYEKVLEISEDQIGSEVLVVFEGVYRNSTVYLNDVKVGSNAYGYTEFSVNISEQIIIGTNVLKVEVDNVEQPSGRWYTGGGIYRPVYMLEGKKDYVKYNGVKIKTLSIDPVIINVQVDMVGNQPLIEILDCGKVVDSKIGSNIDFNLENVKLWSIDNPNLYTYRITTDEDVVEGKFGIRSIDWNNQGFFLNNENVLMRGACVHHDNGIIGARTYRETEFRKVRILKQAGYNSIRSSHNPASKYLLEACDHYGMLVIDETWDVWYKHKNPFDYASDFADNYDFDIKSLVSRNYNHPSVVMYSLGNEISEPGTSEGMEWTKKLISTVKKYDDTRAVTAGINLFLINQASKGKAIYNEDGSGRKQEPETDKKSGSLFFNILTSFIGSAINRAANSKKADKVTSPVLDILDIAGYNYASGRYSKEGELHPERIVVGSETFPQDIYKNWEMVKRYPYLIGDFMWTGWDYLGEAGMGAWAYSSEGARFEKPFPWILADVGAIDILGNIGAPAHYAKVVWGLTQKPYIGVRPVKYNKIIPKKSAWRGTNAIDSWSWIECEGNRAIIEVYSVGSYVSLYINENHVGKKKLKEYKALFKTKYHSGTIRVESYDEDNQLIETSMLESAKGDLRLRINAENPSEEIVYFNIDVVDQSGVIESNADDTLEVNVTGGNLIGFGSANPKTEQNYSKGVFDTYFGRSQAVIQITDQQNFELKVTGTHYDSVTYRYNQG